ncbi:MAG: spore coat U domain-containing protein [Gammaproteobacteria bacterium]
MPIKILCLILLLLLSNVAFAKYDSYDCSVSATPVAFGKYNPFGSDVDVTGTVSVSCEKYRSGSSKTLVKYTIKLSKGNSGSYSERKLESGSNALLYNLYTSGSYNEIWGNGKSGTEVVSDKYYLDGKVETKDYTVYGRIPGYQNVPVGSYTDTIKVRVKF